MGKSLVIKGADFSNSAISKSGYFGQYNIYTPAQWKPTDEPVNIIEKFRNSKFELKRYIFTIDDNATSVGNNTFYLDSTVFYETIDGQEQVSYFDRGTNITPTAGSTKRYAIVRGRPFNNTSKALPIGARWLHLGDTVEMIDSNTLATNCTLKIITQDGEVLKETGGYLKPQQAGILELPPTITFLTNGFDATNVQAIVIHSLTPPTGTTTGGGYSNISCNIYVPDAAVDTYKSAVRFSTYADKIKPMSQYNREDYIIQS